MVALPICPHKLHCAASHHGSCGSNGHVVFAIGTDVAGDCVRGEKAVGNRAVIFESAGYLLDGWLFLSVFVRVPRLYEVVAEPDLLHVAVSRDKWEESDIKWLHRSDSFDLR